MTPKLTAIFAGAIVAAAALTVASIRPDSRNVVLVGESKVTHLADGSVAYVVETAMADGTRTAETRKEAPCRRRPVKVDGSLCRRTFVGLDGKVVTQDAPALNRYRAAEMTGDGCEGVACSVWAGENADAPEARK